MKIAVNTRLLQSKGMDGIGWFSYHTLQRIVKVNPQHQFIFIFDRKYDEKFIFADNVTPVIIPPPTRHPILIYAWFEYAIPKVLKKHKPDIFLSPDGFLSLKTNVKQLPVIHDVNFHYFPEDFSYSARILYTKCFPQYAEKACRIATVSEFSKQDIVKFYNINPNLIDVVYNGANEIYKPVKKEQQQKVKIKFANGKPYFVFVGTLLPRKNISNMLKAFNILKKENKFNHQLMFIGNKKHWTANMETAYQALNGNRKDVIFKSWTSPNELVDIVGSSEGMLYPSKFEGFGVPILEGMRAGVPVITANNSSMPEVAGNAALLVDSQNPNDIAEKMKTVITDETLSQSLVKRGLERANFFSWDKSANLLWESVEKAVKQ